MSNDTTAQTDAQTPDEVLDYIPDAEDSNELADHLVATIEVLADEVMDGDLDSEDVDMGMMGMMGPEMALEVIKPLARRWAVQNPEQVVSCLARLHLETGALIEHHGPDHQAPEDLLDL